MEGLGYELRRLGKRPAPGPWQEAPAEKQPLPVIDDPGKCAQLAYIAQAMNNGEITVEQARQLVAKL
jgi:hypothetical protein